MSAVVALPGFDEATRRSRWAGETLPVLYDGPRTCVRCGFGTVVTFPPVTEDAMFFHGGYGESVRRTVAVCLACGRSYVVRRETVRPPRGAVA